MKGSEVLSPFFFALKYIDSDSNLTLQQKVI